MLTYLVECEEALILDCLDDRPLADAVAAAYLGVFRHRQRARLALMAGIAEIRLAEHQVVADVSGVAPGAHRFEFPRAARRIAVQHAADQPVVADHDFLVDAARGI